VDELARRYANQVHVDPSGATLALVVNTRVAPFDRLAARQALNYAIDRNRIARLTGSPLTAQPTCQVLPPTVPGYRPYCPYTLDRSPSGLWTAPDLARAERMVARSGTRGTTVTLLMLPHGAPGLRIGGYIVSVLDRLGYRASLRVIKNAGGLGDLGDSSKRPQIGWFGWLQDYPTPSNFFKLLLSCRSFVPRSPNNLNAAEFCDPRLDAQVDRAAALQAREPAAAGELWSRIDHELVDRAPWVPVYISRTVTVLGHAAGSASLRHRVAYDTQSAYVIPVQGTQATTYIYAGDRWQDPDLVGSKYIWLPIKISGNSLSLDYYAEWQLNVTTGRWSVQVNDGFIPQSAWTLLYADSEETQSEDGRARNAFDDSPSTIWHTQYTGTAPAHPHEIQIDLGATYALTGFRYLPRQDKDDHGMVAQYQVYASTDSTNWGTAVASGTFNSDRTEKRVMFTSKTARYVRFVALSEINGQPWASVAELDLIGVAQ